MTNAKHPDQSWPVWVEDLNRSLFVRSHFVLSGNIHDVYLTPLDGRVAMLGLKDCLWAAMVEQGFELLVVYDRLDGIRVFPDTPEKRRLAQEHFNFKLEGGRFEVSLRDLPRHLEAVASSRDLRAGFIVDYASRLALRAQGLSEDEHEFFMAIEKMSYDAVAQGKTGFPGPFFNPTVWVVNKENDLPDWLLVENERIRSKTLLMPSYDARQAAAAQLIPTLDGYEDADEENRLEMVDDFTDHTDGMPLTSMIAITQLAIADGIKCNEIQEAIRVFKLGVTSNPWNGKGLRRRIASAEDDIGSKLLGQQQAINKTVDILKRSITGLTGAQTAKTSGRPRGVLFFAGPTGVGKTFLAKSITETIFGDEKAYLRFDMSEFSAEHSDARLLGAPPGYVGYNAGGELTNSVRERPFSVILFDEIEKANPRILDKFLQILEDGRITDGRGNTVYFSESIIIFTSNLGIYIKDDAGKRVLNVEPGVPYGEVERRVRLAIQNYFKFELSRPEILNRIGDNIVVFNFIEPEVAEAIFSGMLDNVRHRVMEKFGAELVLEEEARQQILHWCTENLDNGGRGIGNRLETTLVNPLARALFDVEQVGNTVRVLKAEQIENIHHVRIG